MFISIFPVFCSSPKERFKKNPQSTREEWDEAKYEKKWRNIVSSLEDCIQFNAKEFTQMLLWKQKKRVEKEEEEVEEKGNISGSYGGMS